MRTSIIAAFLALSPLSVVAQQNPQLTCDATAEPNQIRSEGLTERLGAIIISCQGPASGMVSGGFSLSVSAPVTNILSANGTVDVSLMANTVAGLSVLSPSAMLVNQNYLFFNSFNFQLPASGQTTFRIQNIRVAANSVGNRSITVFISTSGQTGIGIRNNPVTAGVPVPSLYVNYSSARIVCLGSPLPDALGFTNLFAAGTQFASVRVTEGFPSAFEPKQPGATNGMRFVLTYTGFPSDAQIFVPNLIAGSDAVEQTSTGEFGVSLISGGRYAQGPGGSLLLSLVRSADPTGAGDMPLYSFGLNGLFQDVTQIPLSGGNGWAVYEVIDASASTQESAMIPTFVSLPPSSANAGTVASIAVNVGPVSNVRTASATAPVTRYVLSVPPTDCGILLDCNATYFPKLYVNAPQLNFQAPQATPGFYQAYIPVQNSGGGNLFWTTNITYASGSNWLQALPSAGVNNASIILSAHPEKLAPGVYQATLVIDAGPVGGQQSYLVTMTVVAGTGPPPMPPPPANQPRFWTVGNAANLSIGTLVPGSLASIQGTKLSGKNVAVTFDGLNANIVSQSDGFLTVVVPPDLGLRTSSQLVVTVDTVASDPMTVPIGLAAPAIFSNSVFNQDGTMNSASNPELSGNILQIFATGLPLSAYGSITARIQDRVIQLPYYAGPAPGSPGVQQVDIRIPGDLPSLNSEVVVCGVPLSDPTQQFCSLGAPATIQQQ